MKIAMLYGPYSTANRLFDLTSDITKSPFGMTGSETSFFTISTLLQKMGHDVTICAPVTDACDGMIWNNVIKIRKSQDVLSVVDGSFHAAYAWNEPNLLRNIDWHVIRMCNFQINDFYHCAPDCDDFVDIWTSPSDSHKKIVGPNSPKHNPDKWFVITNGCDPSLYSPGYKVDGRVIWASSPDRGLHWLLSIWPKVKKAVPHAELKIFYKLKVWIDHFIKANPNANPTYPELIARAFYIKESIRRLENYGVELCDSVSRVQMIQEMNEAQILAYTCDPVLYTEGFSVSIMEACASGTLPIITDADALGEIYGGSVPMVTRPFSDHIGEYTDLLIRSLTDPDFRNGNIKLSRELADNYTWYSIASNVEKLIRQQRTNRGWSCS